MKIDSDLSITAVAGDIVDERSGEVFELTGLGATLRYYQELRNLPGKTAQALCKILSEVLGVKNFALVDNDTSEVLLELVNGLIDSKNLDKTAADDVLERARNAGESCRQNRAARAELTLRGPWCCEDQDEDEKPHPEFVIPEPGLPFSQSIPEQFHGVSSF